MYLITENRPLNNRKDLPGIPVKLTLSLKAKLHPLPICVGYPLLNNTPIC